MSILVIDQHPLMREAVGALICRLSPTINVLELDRFAAVSPTTQAHARPELICLELSSPDARGIPGVRQLRRQFPDSPIVVLTAESAQEYEKLCVEAGANAFIPKSA
ncbi:MAG: response regulator transcription factor, partial [Polaromonas sp.]|nr:response regulator transcription factor [Polaromonas sp.]